jgi:hypothetical protein
LNTTDELTDLYATAKAADKLDLSFRILAHLEKMKPRMVTLSMLYNEDIKCLIAEGKTRLPDVPCDGADNH